MNKFDMMIESLQINEDQLPPDTSGGIRSAKRVPGMPELAEILRNFRNASNEEVVDVRNGPENMRRKITITDVIKKVEEEGMPALKNRPDKQELEELMQAIVLFIEKFRKGSFDLITRFGMTTGFHIYDI